MKEAVRCFGCCSAALLVLLIVCGSLSHSVDAQGSATPGPSASVANSTINAVRGAAAALCVHVRSFTAFRLQQQSGMPLASEPVATVKQRV